MSNFTIYFNEICVHSFIDDEFKIFESIDEFLLTIEAAIKLRSDVKIGFLSENWNGEINGLSFSQHVRQRLLSQKTRYQFILKKIKILASDELRQEHEVMYDGQTTIGLTLADFSAVQMENGWAVSLGNNDRNQWISRTVSVERYLLSNDGLIEGPHQCEVGHLSKIDHVESWSKEIQDWGREISQSCVLGMIGSHPIVMYPGPKEHNPPHVHLRINASQIGDIAKYRIEDFVREKGEPKWDKEMSEWLKKYQAQLMKSWDRCQRGYHPYKLV